MTVYVDRLQNYAANPKANSWWCHMWSSDLDELHRMAAVIGLKPSWIQVGTTTPPIYHYDLSARFRVLAVQRGAVEVASAAAWIREQRVKGEAG